MLAMHALPRARSVMGQLNGIEAQLDELMSRLARDSDEPAQESELRELTTLAARIEHIVAVNAYRFAAARAYSGLVERRLKELEEGKIGTAPRYGDFC